MKGPIWIASYGLLCILVVWLWLGLLSLYRKVDGVPRPERWPGPGFKVGAPLPQAIAAPRGPRSEQGWSLLVVVGDDDALAFPAVQAAAVLAREYGLELGLGHVGRDPRPPAWVADVSPPPAATFPITPAARRLSEMADGPTCLLLFEDRLVDAALGATSPAHLRAVFCVYLDSEVTWTWPDQAARSEGRARA